MSGDVVVRLENVSKYYKLYDSPRDRLKEALSPFRKKYHKEFYALQNISFELKRGECLGIIGRNGMGKSTLLKLVAHIIEPSSGTVIVNGTVSALLELGAGFNPEFTGLQNIYFYGTILGFKRSEIEQKVEEIISFADIGDFINQPVKTYSSGMFVRLAFAVQTNLKPDILLVDEVLSVGDIFFQQKCHARIEELLSKGTALILVSHDMQMIEKYSNTAMLLKEGTCIISASPNEVVYNYYRIEKSTDNKKNISIYKNYTKPTNNEPSLSKDIIWPAIENFTIPNLTHDSSVALCTGIALCNKDNIACNNFNIGETAYLFYEIKLFQDIGFPYGMATLINSKNIIIHAKDTLQYDVNETLWSTYRAGTVLRFVQSFRLSISEGEYTLSIGFGHVNPQDVPLIKKTDYSKRSSNMGSILGIVKPIKFSVTAHNKNLAFPFHGYVDLDGSYLLQAL
jgi:ABC-type polysaccharide/polyol phosphate transport system ATPase subunit